MTLTVVASAYLLKAEAGSRPGGRGTCSLLRQRKVPKRKATPLPVSPFALAGDWGSLRCSVLGCAAELAAFFELRSNSCGKPDNEARVLRHALTPGPALLGTVRRGWERAPLGPLLRSAPFRHRCASASAARSAYPTPGAAAQQQPSLSPLPTPAGCAEKRRGWGGCVCRRTHALRALACRCCLSGVHPQGERSEFIGTTPGPSIAGCPRSPDRAKGGRRLGVAFSLVTFSWRRKRKLLRRRAHTPASALNQSTQQPQHKRQANGL